MNTSDITTRFFKHPKIFAIVPVFCFVFVLMSYPHRSWAQEAFSSEKLCDKTYVSRFDFTGPRQKIPADVPDGNGFWSFAIPVKGVVSRSGQPTINEFRWLSKHGWRSVIDLRQSNDAKIQGFNELHFRYLHLPIVDNSTPTDQQVQEFLHFVTDPKDQPVHVHCHAGVGRTGIMIAVYRYSVQSWPMDQAINEARLFSGGVNKVQRNWLKHWEQRHKLIQ